MATVTSRPPGLRGYDARWYDSTGTALVGPDGEIRTLVVTRETNSVVVHDTVNLLAPGVNTATISGGGSTVDPQMIGYGHNRTVFSTTGTAFSWPYLPTGSLSDLRVWKLSALNVITQLASPAGYTAVVNGSAVDITLAVALVANERLFVEDPLAQVLVGGTLPQYSGIGSGYDNVIYSGVMHQVTGAHHRVTGGDHGSIIGGSYGIISAGSYGAILGGTNNEISSASPGCVVAGGYRNHVSGATGAILGGQENKVSSSYGVASGYRNSVSGTASFVTGRNNTVSGSDSIVAGDGNTNSGNYAYVFGRGNTNSNTHSAVDGGYGIATAFQGERVRWGYKDTASGLNVYRKVFAIDLSVYSTGIDWHLLQTLDGVTELIPPANSTWKCRLQIAANNGAKYGLAFEAVFSLQRVSTTPSLIGAVTTVMADVNSTFGTAGNIATFAVAVATNGITISVRSRQDSSVSAKWFGWLDVIEVT